MMSKEINKPAANLDKQVQPMPGEVDPKNAKVGAFVMMQKAKNILRVKR